MSDVDDSQAEKGNPRRRNAVLLMLLFVLIIFPTVPLLLYRYAIHSAPQTMNSTTFEIASGKGVSEIASNLLDAGLIRSEFMFKVYLKLSGIDNNIQAGIYNIPPATSMEDLVKILQHGRDDVTIRYIEGWRVEQLGVYLVEELDNFDYSRFVEKARPYEGLLFPDTYIVKSDTSVEDLILLLRESFEAKTADLLTKEKLEKAGITEAQAIILASMIEREAIEDEDKRLIAGILLRRLEEGMRLEVDATTQYAIALQRHCRTSGLPDCMSGLNPEALEDITWWPNDLTMEELQYESPYNTRAVDGLPPTPISSFSLNSLVDVLNYIPSDNYFYLTDDDGVTHFSKTYEEHLQKVNRYLSN